jgi:hypothetical protein
LPHSPQNPGTYFFNRKASASGKESKGAQKVSDIGPEVGASNINTPQDSFEKYYSKELDLDEGKIPLLLNKYRRSPYCASRT